MFKHIRVSTCMFLLLLVFFVMQLVNSGLSLYAAHTDKTNFEQISNTTQQRDALSQSWSYLLQTRNTLNRAATRLALKQPQDNITQLMADAKASLKKAEDAYAAFLALPRRTEKAAELTAVNKASYQQLHDMLQSLNDMLSAGDMQGFLNGPAQKYQDQFQKDVGNYTEYVGGRFQQAQQQTVESYQNVMVNTSVIIVLLVLLTALALIITRRILFTPLTVMRGHFDRIGAGDISAPIAVEGRYEIKVMLDSLQQMQQSLANTVRTVRHGADTMFSGLKGIAVGNTDLSARTEQQASALEETAASMEQLTATVKQNAENARQATQLARDASNTAEKGGELTGNVVKTMNDIAGSSKKISAITSVIDGIAFQTNILALNAAVEAARAGEQGRGFAVVAGEVRSLAQRSAQAAKEIKALIDESVSRVSQGSALVESAGNTMDDIVRAVTRVTDIMGEIASASDEQSRGIEQVSIAVTQMDQVTQQNATLVQQAASSTHALEVESENLTRAVSVFRLATSDGVLQPRNGQVSGFTPRQVTQPALLPATARAGSADNWETF
ncbi:methyl-accepting chemotaxis protein [Rahnella inusitata]|uniref:HAMP domain-containing protein n=1 Tax=Rahnella inusitata TaxID=58169 RepID=A0ABX9P5L8_9GAMM|nr:methyl-accepting chemotaxis protein [Rahnella inusitata]NMC24772.1 HAMP domain-containing protein [Serratia sp. (in: enterobacteria)]RJT14869.1 HAMP domain-containing protein [Rahnella inusitata]